MPEKTIYIPGDWNAVCDVCGFEFKASQLRKRWDGYRVCSKDWEQRHPQDFIRGKPERNRVPWARQETPDIFVSNPHVLTTESSEPLTTELGVYLTTEDFTHVQNL